MSLAPDVFVSEADRLRVGGLTIGFGEAIQMDHFSGPYQASGIKRRYIY